MSDSLSSPDMTQAMTQVHDLGGTYDEVLTKFRASLDDTRRHWLAYMLVNYPHRQVLQVIADAVRVSVKAERVEINALYEGAQVTVACAPAGIRHTVRESESLCVLTAGTGWPLAVDDIAHDPITQDHPAREYWGSWASVPLVIGGKAAGSICALEKHERTWTLREQDVMTSLAKQLSIDIEEWIESERPNESA